MKKILSLILFITLICSSQAFSRNFPSKFSPWVPCGNDPLLTASGKWEWYINLDRSQFPPGYPVEDPDWMINFMIRAAQYDLHWNIPWGYPTGTEPTLGMVWDNPVKELATSFTQDSIQKALKRRAYMKQLNPDLTLLMDLHWTMVNELAFPADHPWWLRDVNGNRIVKWSDTTYLDNDKTLVKTYYYMDINNPDYINHLVQRAVAAVNSGVYEGVLLDCAIDFMWERLHNGVNNDPTNLIMTLRAALGSTGIIILNTSYNFVPQWAPYINGVFMEAVRTDDPNCDWGVISGGACFADEVERWQSLEGVISSWHHNIVHQPKIIALELQTPNRQDVAEMRAATALTMTHTNGYILYADAYYFPSENHLHNWYSFWDEDLGVPTSGRIDRNDGSFQREYSKGTVIYNPLGNGPVTVSFSDERRQASTGAIGYSFVVNGKDGDMFIKDPVKQFVTRFYQQCLGRNPDGPGLNSWSGALSNGTMTGADLAFSFVFSTEFINMGTTNEEFVTVLYRAFFDREPDSTGFNGWLASMNAGIDRATVLDGFVGAQEFLNLCNGYGIRPN
jgi:hypothetical protein